MFLIPMSRFINPKSTASSSCSTGRRESINGHLPQNRPARVHMRTHVDVLGAPSVRYAARVNHAVEVHPEATQRCPEIASVLEGRTSFGARHGGVRGSRPSSSSSTTPTASAQTEAGSAAQQQHRPRRAHALSPSIASLEPRAQAFDPHPKGGGNAPRGVGIRKPVTVCLCVSTNSRCAQQCVLSSSGREGGCTYAVEGACGCVEGAFAPLVGGGWSKE
ncbi:hypothetical protein DENSPDRAFT_595022 [Dentipellis sp. KUC8613]|nr:hypothetical protein DENSPDRAFT_595022 [Dentipellis sp. KUC8613]